jgi:hypothetical protein
MHTTIFLFCSEINLCNNNCEVPDRTENTLPRVPVYCNIRGTALSTLNTYFQLLRKGQIHKEKSFLMSLHPFPSFFLLFLYLFIHFFCFFFLSVSLYIFLFLSFHCPFRTSVPSFLNLIYITL